MNGASLTISSVIPVNSEILFGIGQAGFTKELKHSITCPSLIFTAPISVIFSFSGDSPVVSISNTTKL